MVFGCSPALRTFKNLYSILVTANAGRPACTVALIIPNGIALITNGSDGT